MADDVTVRRNRARGRLRRALAAAGALVALASPAVADAQQRTFYLDRLFMAGAPDDMIGLWRPHMGEQTRFFGQLGFRFAYDPFRLENEISNSVQRGEIVRRGGGTPVQYQLQAYADVGIEILDRFS